MAITRSEGPLDGRNLLIKDGTSLHPPHRRVSDDRRGRLHAHTGDDFTGRPAKAKTGASDAGGGEGGTPAHKAATADGQGLSKTAREILRAQTQPPAPTLYLGNLAFATTEASIRELFEAHRNWRRKGKKGKAMEAHGGDGGGVEGKDGTDTPNDVWIRKIRMATFEDSGNCKGSVSHISTHASPSHTITHAHDVFLCVCGTFGDDDTGSPLSTLRASSTPPQR